MLLPSAAAAEAAPTSTPPTSTPIATKTITSVCIAGTRRAPPRGRPAFGSGRHERDAGSSAKSIVPLARMTPAAARAIPVERSAARPRASGGPTTQVSSTAEVSTA